MKDKLIKMGENRERGARHLFHIGMGFLFLFLISGFSQVYGLDKALSDNAAMQQAINVTGIVTDASRGETLPGVSVSIRGTTLGTVTDVDGRYTLAVRSPADVLVFSFVGYSPYEVQVGDQRTIDVALNLAITALDEIVVVGYGTQRRGDVTSAVSTVSREDFLQGSVRDAAQLIQGRTAGLTVSTPSGDPVAGTQIMLRGITTLMAGTAPLVLIDGVPGNLQSVAPEDIESIDVLKDGSAAAIYGTRGTNGVILITTRSGIRDTPATLEYSSYASTQSIMKRPAFLSAEQYVQKIQGGMPWQNFGYQTDWLDEITRTPVSHVHNVTLRGGSRATSYIGNLNFRQIEGLFMKSYNQMMTGRLEVDHSMFDDMLNAVVTVNNRIREYGTTGDGYSFNTTTYRQALIRNPTDRVMDDNGRWVEHPGVFQYENPVARLMETFGENVDKQLRMSGRLTFQPMRDLRFVLLGHRTLTDEIRGYSESKNHISTVRDGRNGFASRGASASRNDLIEFTGHYGMSIERHRMGFLAGYSWQDQDWENFWMQNWDFPTDAYSYNNIGQGNARTRGQAPTSSSKAMSRLIGFFGRVNYTYADRYMVMASVRHEGSSKFGSGHQWGTFPAVSVGWALARESFMQNATMVDELKIRAGYGVTGTEPGNPYMSLTRLTYGARFLAGGQWVPSIQPASNPNPDLRWERKEEINFGVDFSFFGGRVDGAIDLYERNTYDMLWNYSVPVPPYLFGTIMANVGQIQNRGVETLVRVIPVQTADFRWQSGFTYSTNDNKLVSLSDETFKTTQDWFNAGYTGDPIQAHTHRVQIGGPIGNFHGYKVIDVDEQGRWILEDKDGNPIPAANRTPDDKKVLGNGLPKHYLSWNNTFRYRNLDLNVSMRGAFGYQILNFQRMFYENPQVGIRYNVLESAFDPVFGKQVLNFDQEFVSYYIEDGDFWKIDNVTLGYTFDVNNVNFIRNARIYVAGLNLMTITGYKGMDPEVNRMGMDPGNDQRDQYPTTRTISFGLNITF
jgi:TonB-dependent starch-binding outer membrane protein SusC